MTSISAATATASSATVSAPSTTVSAIETFIAAHGGSARVVVQPVGRAGVRLTLVGADGVLGDRMVADLATADAVVAAVADLETAEWDLELTSTVTPAPGHWAKMAGWVARSTRFPAARNER